MPTLHSGPVNKGKTCHRTCNLFAVVYNTTNRYCQQSQADRSMSIYSLFLDVCELDKDRALFKVLPSTYLTWK